MTEDSYKDFVKDIEHIYDLQTEQECRESALNLAL